MSASTVRSRVAHKQVSQCFTSLAFSSSCKYLAITDGEIIRSAVLSDESGTEFVLDEAAAAADVTVLSSSVNFFSCVSKKKRLEINEVKGVTVLFLSFSHEMFVWRLVAII